MGGGVFCKKKWKMGAFCKKVENGGCFEKKWTFSQRMVHYVHYQYFLFYILLIWGCVRIQRTPCLRAWSSNYKVNSRTQSSHNSIVAQTDILLAKATLELWITVLKLGSPSSNSTFALSIGRIFSLRASPVVYFAADNASVSCLVVRLVGQFYRRASSDNGVQHCCVPHTAKQ